MTIMVINKKLKGSGLTIELEGRLDTITAPDLEGELDGVLDEVDVLVFDLEKLEYISSAGLRVLLSAHKKMAKANGMMIENVNEAIMEVFDITGFADILNIK